MAKATINERRAALTDMVNKARNEWQIIRRDVNSAIRRANPGIDYWELWDKTDNDPRVKVAEAKLMALCDAARIMGAELF